MVMVMVMVIGKEEREGPNTKTDAKNINNHERRRRMRRTGRNQSVRIVCVTATPPAVGCKVAIGNCRKSAQPESSVPTMLPSAKSPSSRTGYSLQCPMRLKCK